MYLVLNAVEGRKVYLELLLSLDPHFCYFLSVLIFFNFNFFLTKPSLFSWIQFIEDLEIRARIVSTSPVDCTGRTFEAPQPVNVKTVVFILLPHRRLADNLKNTAWEN